MENLMGFINYSHVKNEYDSEFDYDKVHIQIFNGTRIIRTEDFVVDRLIIQGGSGIKIYQLLHILDIDEEDSTKVEYINLGFYSTQSEAEKAWHEYLKVKKESSTKFSIREYELDEKPYALFKH